MTFMASPESFQYRLRSNVGRNALRIAAVPAALLIAGCGRSNVQDPESTHFSDCDIDAQTKTQTLTIGIGSSHLASYAYADRIKFQLIKANPKRVDVSYPHGLLEIDRTAKLGGNNTIVFKGEYDGRTYNVPIPSPIPNDSTSVSLDVTAICDTQNNPQR